LGAFGFLVFYRHRVAVLIQNPDAIGRIVDDLQPMARLCSARPAGMCRRSIIPHYESRISGWGADLHTVRPGQFVLEGECLAVISPSAAASILMPPVIKGIELERHRVLSQDLEFGIAQMVEIAIRALSPAVNDTFTGVATVDLLGRSVTMDHDDIQAAWRKTTETLKPT